MPARTLSEVLNIRPGQRVSLLGVRDVAFLREVFSQVVNPEQHRAAFGSNVIVLAAESPMQLKRIAPLRRYLAPAGVLWVLFSSLSDDQVQTAVREAGFEVGETQRVRVSSSVNELVETMAICASLPPSSS